jgi:hypothetical protein
MLHEVAVEFPHFVGGALLPGREPREADELRGVDRDERDLRPRHDFIP